MEIGLTAELSLTTMEARGIMFKILRKKQLSTENCWLKELPEEGKCSHKEGMRYRKHRQKKKKKVGEFKQTLYKTIIIIY